MTKNFNARSRLLVCTVLAAMGALPAQAKAASMQPPASGDAATAAGATNDPAANSVVVTNDIIVTARRSAERLQDVPESVQAVSGKTLQDLAITSAEEVSKLAPGLTLTNQGASSEVTLRGVTWRPGSGTPATPIYFNEVPFDPGNTLVSLFDIGQIEVLRGPQGTSRGAPSISGAVTITTTKPNVDEFGGYVQGQYGEGRHYDVQGALNAPIIKDILAIRIAANIEDSEGTRVSSVNSRARPKISDRSYRATLLFNPTDTVTVEAMYQTRRTNTLQYDQVVGAGSPGAAASPLAAAGLGLGAIPANFNGPPLTLKDRHSVEDSGNITRDRIDLITVNANWRVFGQDLSYNFGRQINRTKTILNAADPLNILPGFEPRTSPRNLGTPFFQTNEIRLSSERSEGRPFDYDIGWFSKHSSGTIDNASPTYLAGAFGGPTALPGAVTTPNPAYILPVDSIIGIGQKFDSFYGDLKFHIDDRTELAGGFAIVRDRVPVSLNVTVGAGLSNAAPLGLLQLSVPAAFRPFFSTCGAFSPVLFASQFYPGVCDTAVAAGTGAPPPQSTNKIYSRALYNFTFSHKFSDALLVYATTGSSYRSGLPALGNVGLPGTLFVPKPESAKSYELGAKTTISRALRVNVSVFQLDYKDQLTSLQGVPYYDSVKGTVDNGGVAFYGNADARVRGFEFEVAAQPIRELSLAANIAYSKIESKGGVLPCGVGPTPTAANPINLCNLKRGKVLNQESPFSATVNGSYTIPLGPLSGYFRFNLDFRGKNPNYGNFVNAAGDYKKTPAYGLLDLFAGVAGEQGVWDVGVFAKNVTNKQVELSRVTPRNNIYSPYASLSGGYDQVRVTLPREIGVSLRYSFGSR